MRSRGGRLGTPCCYVCLTGDVAVRVTDELGFEHWFCAEDWAYRQELYEKIMTMLGDAASEIEEQFLGDLENWKPKGLQPPRLSGPENKN